MSSTTNTAPNRIDAAVINSLQLGGIETSVLDNGPGRGTRIAWVNTGGGLRYKVVIDRGLDIADAEFLGQSLTWHSFTGVTAPRPAYSKGYEWLRSFYGGLCVGCGPLNVGNAFEEDGQGYGLHGTHSNTAAILESVVNPDLLHGQQEMRLSGLVRTARVFGPNIELRRTISSRLGTPEIQITDEFTNRHNETLPLCWLLHINFGYPLLEPGASTFCWRGKETPLGGMSQSWYRKGNDFKSAPQPREDHRGTGEFCAYIDPETDPQQNVLCGVVNRARGIGLKIEFSLREFTRLVNWQHWGPGGSYVGALEPTNAGVEGRPLDAQRGWLQTIAPGETRAFHYKLTAVSKADDLEQLLALNG
jgi:hypothetical protein